MKAVHTELHRSHDPQFFLVRGVVQRTTEQPERADRLLVGLKAGQHELVAPVVFGQGPRMLAHTFRGSSLGSLLGGRAERAAFERYRAIRRAEREYL